MGLENEITLKKTSSRKFKKDYFAPRPTSETLINLKLIHRNLNVMRHWSDALMDYSKEFILPLNKAGKNKSK